MAARTPLPAPSARVIPSRLRAAYWRVRRGGLLDLIPDDALPDRLYLIKRHWRRFGTVRLFALRSRLVPATDAPLPKPATLPAMIRTAERLGAAFAFARVDRYDCGGRIYFSEITHYPWAGQFAFVPPAFDRALGDLWGRGTPIPERFYRTGRAAGRTCCARV